MTDPKKNMVALTIITVVVCFLTYYHDIEAYTLPIMVGAVAIWLIVSPFKIYDNE